LSNKIARIVVQIDELIKQIVQTKHTIKLQVQWHLEGSRVTFA